MTTTKFPNQQQPNSVPLNKGQKIPESRDVRKKEIQEKPKVKIAPINIGESLPTLNSVADQLQLDKNFRLILVTFDIKLISDKYDTEGTKSILELIDDFNKALLDTFFYDPKDNKLAAGIPAEAVAALYLRILRFKLKLCSFEGFLKVAANTKMITSKYKALLQKMNTTNIIFDFKKSNILDIGVESTLRAIKNHLRSFEMELKSYLPALHDLMGLTTITSITDFIILHNAIKNIAPKGLVGIEPDYYYVFRLLLEPEHENKIFDEVQNKQWQTYKRELLELITFCTKKHPELIPPDFTLLTFPFAQPSELNTINIPISLFFNGPCSIITFARFITVLNHIIPAVWLISYNYIAQVHMAKNTQP